METGLVPPSQLWSVRTLVPMRDANSARSVPRLCIVLRRASAIRFRKRTTASFRVAECLALGVKDLFAMQGNSLGGGVGGLGTEGNGLSLEAPELARGQPGLLRDSAAAPPCDALPNVGTGALLFADVLIQGRSWQGQLPGCLGLGKGLGLDEVVEELGCGAAGHAGARFMNPNSAKVKSDVEIHEPERAKLLSVKPEKPAGRASDDAVAWYLRMRLERIIDVEKSKRQSQIADEADIPRSALSNIYLHAKGAGPGTAGPLAKYLGFTSRGAMVDEADRWWNTPEGRDFMLDRMNPRDRDKHFPKKARRKSA